jgi:hypothetical protein
MVVAPAVAAAEVVAVAAMVMTMASVVLPLSGVPTVRRIIVISNNKILILNK